MIQLCICVYVHTHTHTHTYTGFPDGSVGKESACNAGDVGKEFLGWEGPLEEGMATHSRFLDWRIP